MNRCKTPFHAKYHLYGCILDGVLSVKYLGVTISEDLKWTDHVNDIVKKAYKTLGLLERNIQGHNRDLKSTAYKTLVLPQLEYASTVWSPHTDQYTDKLESIQSGKCKREEEAQNHFKRTIIVANNLSLSSTRRDSTGLNLC